MLVAAGATRLGAVASGVACDPATAIIRRGSLLGEAPILRRCDRCQESKEHVISVCRSHRC